MSTGSELDDRELKGIDPNKELSEGPDDLEEEPLDDEESPPDEPSDDESSDDELIEEALSLGIPYTELKGLKGSGSLRAVIGAVRMQQSRSKQEDEPPAARDLFDPFEISDDDLSDADPEKLVGVIRGMADHQKKQLDKIGQYITYLYQQQKQAEAQQTLQWFEGKLASLPEWVRQKINGSSARESDLNRQRLAGTISSLAERDPTADMNEVFRKAIRIEFGIGQKKVAGKIGRPSTRSTPATKAGARDSEMSEPDMSDVLRLIRNYQRTNLREAGVL